MPSRPSSRSGFTLAEVLVAILLTGLIAGIIYGSYMGSLRLIGDAYESMERAAVARQILGRMEADLSCAFLRADREWLVFVGEEGGGGGLPRSTIAFIASNRGRSSRDAPESELSEVAYFLDPGEGARLHIMRREDPTLDGDPFSGGETRIIGEGVAGLRFEYFDGDGWAGAWDSREANELPLAVRVTLTFRTDEGRGDEAGEGAVRTTTFASEIAVPLGGGWEEDEEEEEQQGTPQPAAA
ncbi:MAG: type II secretion system protein GspJ [bacterium]|nr:type II secretion system protein GspJ [bacterium]